MTEKEKKSGEISRREFLKDAGLLVGGAAIGSSVILAACNGDGEASTTTVTKTVTSTVPGGTGTVTTTVPGGTGTVTTTVPGGTGTVTITKTVEVQGPGVTSENVIKFTVNGYEYEMQVEPQWTLQYLLHDKLGWIGIKDMCTGYGACGSCTAIVDGRPILTCLTLAADMEGAVIETPEGVAKRNFALIEAYNVNQCSQCGYCTPGFVCTVQALIDKKPKPTAEDVTEAIAGNLCRCGTYRQHVLAVLEATGQS